MTESDQQELSRLRKENAEQRVILKSLETQLKAANETNAELKKLLKELQEKLDILIVQFKKRNRREFGEKTERHNPRPALAPQKPKERKGTNAEEQQENAERKRIMSSSLPVVAVPHAVSPEAAVCPHCSVDTVFVRNEISHQLERVRHSLQQLQHQQEVRACPKCKEYIVTAEKPCPPIPGSYAGPALLADIVVSKLADGLPNHRQQRRFEEEEAIIPRSTQCDWMKAIAQTVMPLRDLMKKEILEAHVVQTDESELKVQQKKCKIMDEEKKPERTMRKGKMTVYRGDRNKPYTIFDFSANQTFAGNIEFLKDFIGIVQADAATGFDALFKDGSKTEAGCHAHARRRFFDCLVIEPIMANKVLEIYKQLYKIEDETRNAKGAVRLAKRRRYSKPLIKELRTVITGMGSSPMALK